MQANIVVAPLLPEHWDVVRAIYLEGIATGNATFETGAPEWEEWDREHHQNCRLVALGAGTVLGWAALSPVSRRLVYAGVAELSLYVAEQARGRGAGRALIAAVIQASESAGIWTLQAAIFPENTASIELHKHSGFRIMGTRERLGFGLGRWRDVVLMERRSAVTGR